ncbi:hypothetical protein STAL104432_19110 [Streptomyces albus]
MRGGRQLHLQPGDGQHPVQDVHERVGQRTAQVAQLGGEPCEAHPGLGGERQLVVVAVGFQEGVQGVGEGPQLGRVGALDGGGQPLVRVRALVTGALVGDQQGGAAAEQRQVAGADPPAGAGQQPHQRRVGGGVLEDLADGHQVGDLRQVQQPGQADHLDGQVPRGQSALDLGEIGGTAAQDGDLTRRRAGVHQVGEGVGEPGDLLRLGVQQGDADEAVVFGTGRGAERLDPFVPLPQGRGQPVGEGQQPAAAAPVLAQRLAAGRGAVGVREVAGEVVEVGDGGAPPAVDGLAGVADGGHRVAGALPEQSGEQDPLGDGGVLVLVQQDDGELFAQRPGDVGQLCEAGGQRDLVAEVDAFQFPFAGAVLLDEAQQLVPRPRGLGNPAQLVVGEAGALQRGEEFRIVGAGRLRADQVLGQFGVQREQVLHQGGHRLGERLEGPFGGPQYPGRQLEAGGVRQQPHRRLDAQPQPVLAQQPPRERVVGGDLRLPRLGRLAGPRIRRRVGVQDTGPVEGLADAVRQLTGRLVGERQPQDPVRRDLSGAHQPHHAGRHDGRLARPGPGHDHLRGGRRGDAGRLLRGERDAEQLGELRGVGELCGHSSDASARG